MNSVKTTELARRIADLLAREPELRQTDIARKLGEYDSTVMRTLAHLDEFGIFLAEDEAGRLSLAERRRKL